MGKFHTSIQPAHREFIEKQHLFFVGTAPLDAESHVNLSPKGLNTFRVFSENSVGYLDFVGSGNETSAHILQNGRITFMFCSFEGPPNILRLYGKGTVVLPGTEEWERYAAHFDILTGSRQIITAEISLVQTSCGFGVPLYDYVGERTFLAEWTDKKGKEGLKEYIREKNLRSLDQLPTHHGQEDDAGII